MATDKLGLPKITGNMTADVVRDLNALADAVDNIAGKSDGLATLGPDGKVPAEQVNVDTSKLATKAEVTSGLGGKVDKVEGKQLSTEDYTSTEKAKLTGIELGANKYTHPSTHPASIITETASKRFVSDAEKAEWDVKETPAGAQAKVDTHEGKKTNPHGVTKAQVGLGNVDNVKQASKAEHDELQTQVTTHLADYAELKGDLSTLKTSAKDSIPNIVNELFTNVSDGKQLIGTVITDVDENVYVPINPSFNDLADAIGQIKTGKKWASGTASALENDTFYFGTSGSATVRFMEVLGIDFRPNIIVAHDSANYITIYNRENIYDSSGYKTQIATGRIERSRRTSAEEYGLIEDGEKAYVLSTGFKIPIFGGGASIRWYAYE